jgi:hypothetical protein
MKKVRRHERNPLKERVILKRGKDIQHMNSGKEISELPAK